MASVIQRIKTYHAGLAPQLLDIKWSVMRDNAFNFYRGTCNLFAEDFVKLYDYHKPKVKTWICGDAHFENFGSYKGENRLVYFDMNDFDEAILAGPEPEITRFLASIIVAAEQMNVASVKIHKAIHDIIDGYVATLLSGKPLMLEAEVAHGVFKKYFEQIALRDRQSFIAKRTVKDKGALTFKYDDIHFLPVEDEKKKIKIYESITPLLSHHPHFSHFVYEDVAIRIAGVGSLGLERYCVLCYSKKRGKHYLLDIKEARRSCFGPYINIKQPAFKNEADRIIGAGYMMQFNSPAFEATMNMNDKWFTVKELQLTSDKMTLADFKNDFATMSDVAIEMVSLLAWAQLRSSGHRGADCADDLIKFANKKQWQKDVIDLAGKLAQRNDKYYKLFKSSDKI